MCWKKYTVTACCRSHKISAQQKYSRRWFLLFSREGSVSAMFLWLIHTYNETVLNLTQFTVSSSLKKKHMSKSEMIRIARSYKKRKLYSLFNFGLLCNSENVSINTFAKQMTGCNRNFSKGTRSQYIQEH